jgi:hypothetical protein
MKAYWEYKTLHDNHFEHLECICGKAVTLHELGVPHTCPCGLTYCMEVHIEVEPSEDWWYQQEGK